MHRFLVLIVVFVMSGAAFAQDDPKARAAELFRQADEAADRREPAKAAELYAEAYRIAPHAITKYNEAFEWEKARERARAAVVCRGLAACRRGRLTVVRSLAQDSVQTRFAEARQCWKLVRAMPSPTRGAPGRCRSPTAVRSRPSP